MTRLDTRVLIVGGGPAGATAARELAARGVDTLLLQKDPKFLKPCGGGVPSGAFAELGIPESFCKSKVSCLKIFPPRSEPYDVPFDKGYIGIVDRKEFDSGLRDMARVEDAAVIKGSFMRFISSGKELISEAEIDGERAEIRSEYVIGADGVNSRVRRALGMPPVVSLYTLSGKIPLQSDFCEFYFGEASRGGYSWVFPSGKDSHIGIGNVNSKAVRGGFNDLLSYKGFCAHGGLRGYRIPLWEPESKERPLVKGKVLLAGDAAGLVMPFTFEGIYYAMRSGQFAAEAIIKERPADYRRFLRSKFSIRFRLMKEIWKRYLHDEGGMETLLGVIRNRGVQLGAMRLWLDKKSGRGSLVAFIKALRKFKLF
jgi:geranylgeranyl reductase family protein